MMIINVLERTFLRISIFNLRYDLSCWTVSRFILNIQFTSHILIFNLKILSFTE